MIPETKERNVPPLPPVPWVNRALIVIITHPGSEEKALTFAESPLWLIEILSSTSAEHPLQATVL